MILDLKLNFSQILMKQLLYLRLHLRMKDLVSFQKLT